MSFCILRNFLNYFLNYHVAGELTRRGRRENQLQSYFVLAQSYVLTDRSN